MRRSANLVKASAGLLKKYRTDVGFRRATKYGRFVDTLPVKERTVLYEAGHGAMMGGNVLAVFEELLRDPRFDGWEHVWVMRDSTHCAEEHRGRKNLSFVKANTHEYLIALATTKYLVNDSTFPTYFSRRPEQVYLNTWHGTPLKKMGRDAEGVVAQHKNVQHNFLHVTHFASPNSYTTEKFLACLDLQNVFPGRVLEQGSPRLDMTLACDAAALRRRLNVPPGKKLLLYAPTWRGENSKPTQDVGNLPRDILAIQKGCPEYHVVLRVHHWASPYVKAAQVEGMLVPSEIDTNVLLGAVDLLITDYSSVLFDFLPRRKPIVYYAHDREVYERERGMYFPMEELPGTICSTVGQVIEAVRSASDFGEDERSRHQAAIARFCAEDDGGSAKRIVDEVFFGISRGRSFSVVDKSKKTILLYSASFLNNGITSSLLNLLSMLDPDRFNILVIDKDSLNDEGKKNVRRLPPHVGMLYRTGLMNARLRERLAEEIGTSGALEEDKKIPWDSYRKERRRVLGDAHIDAYVDFSGYSKFWAMLFASAESGWRCIYQHNDVLAEYGKKKHQRSFGVIFHLYKYFDRVICVGKYTREINVRNMKDVYLPNAEERIVVVHNTIDPRPLKEEVEVPTQIVDGVEYWVIDRQDGSGSADLHLLRRPSEGERVFVTMGRLWPEKDHAKLIAAFAQVYAKHQDARLYILGEGVLRAALEKQVERAGLQDAVFLPGHVPNPFPLLKASECFVLSSNYEGQPMVLLEAMALGMPIVSTAIPGSLSAIECGYGHLVKNSEAGLRDGLLAALEGKVVAGTFAVDEYNQTALRMFYAEAIGLSEYR